MAKRPAKAMPKKRAISTKAKAGVNAGLAKAKAKRPSPKRPKRETSQERITRERSEAFAAADLTARKQGNADNLKPHQFKPGQSGNPAGRPKGARSKLAEDFIRDVATAWETRGAVAIDMAMAESPMGFVRMVAGIIPQEVDHKFKDLEDLNDDDLDARIARALSLLGGADGRAPQPGADARGEAAPQRAQ